MLLGDQTQAYDLPTKVVSDPSVSVKVAVPGADPEVLLGMEIQLQVLSF
jgi:hypothetical protein